MTLGFHQPPMQMFPAHRRDVPAGQRNELVIDFADPGSITIEFLAKVPGPEMSLGQAEMVFTYKDSFASAHALEGYERLILDAMLGDQSLFTSSAGIERLWEISAPLLENPPPVQPYARGSWGPQSVDRLIARTTGTCLTARPSAVGHACPSGRAGLWMASLIMAMMGRLG